MADADEYETMFAALLAIEDRGMPTVTRDVDRVFLKLVQAPYRGKVPFNQLANMDPEDFTKGESHVEILRWFRKYPSQFVLFEKDNNRISVVGVRVPTVKICLLYLSDDGCKDADCFKFHICRKFIGGHCSRGPSCPHHHHFQNEHNLRLLTKFDLNKFEEEDLRTIFATSHLRVCDIHNRTSGNCDYQDRCTRLHICEDFVRGSCAAAQCKLGHAVDASAHAQRLLRLYALEDKPQQEVLRNLLIVRRRQDGQGTGMIAGKMAAVGGTSAGAANVDRLLDISRLLGLSVKPLSIPRATASNTATASASSLAAATSAAKQPTMTEMRELRLKKFLQNISGDDAGISEDLPPVASEEPSGASHASAADDSHSLSSSKHEFKFGADSDADSDEDSLKLSAAAARSNSPLFSIFSPAAGGAGRQPVWHVEVFGEWRNLSGKESVKIETQFCDADKDNAVATVTLAELGCKSTLAINFEKMSGTLNCGTEMFENIKVKRETTTDSQWLWYWQQDDERSWQQYSLQDSVYLEAAYQRKAPKVFVGKQLVYQIKFCDMMQMNQTTGRMRPVRRRPQQN